MLWLIMIVKHIFKTRDIFVKNYLTYNETVVEMKFAIFLIPTQFPYHRVINTQFVYLQKNITRILSKQQNSIRVRNDMTQFFCS